MYIFEIIAEQRIREAMDRGDFDNNPLAGKPLPRDGMDNIPADLRIAYKILKNAGIVPEELELKKSILTLRDLIEECGDEKELIKLHKDLNEKQLRYSLLMEHRHGGRVDTYYHDKIMEKLI